MHAVMVAFGRGSALPTMGLCGWRTLDPFAPTRRACWSVAGVSRMGTSDPTTPHGYSLVLQAVGLSDDIACRVRRG